MSQKIVIHNPQETSVTSGKPVGEIKTHVVMTFSNIHHWVTELQHKKLIAVKYKDAEAIKALGLPPQAINADSINIEGNDVPFKNISDIVTKDKYYESFPDKNSDYHQPYNDAPYVPMLEKPMFRGDFMAKMIQTLEEDYKKNPTEGRRKTIVSLKEKQRLKQYQKNLEGKNEGNAPVDNIS